MFKQKAPRSPKNQGEAPNWIKEYIQLMLTGDDEKAIKLKLKHFPKRFFKYCSLTEYNLLNLENDEIWLSAIEDLNDPFECSMSFDHLVSIRVYFKSKEFRETFVEKTSIKLSDTDIDMIVESHDPYEAFRKFCEKNNVPVGLTSAEHKKLILTRWAEIRKDVNKMTRVSCFAGRNDSILMWSHYAAKHTGICLEYNFIDTKNARFLIQPIYYCDEFLQIPTFNELTSTSQIMSALHKSSDWSYEQEWRYTGIPNKEGITPQTLAVPKPTAIYLGTWFEKNSPDLRERLIRISEKKEIPLVQMTQDPSAYKIVRKPPE
jgi:Protein of unknown function (DUF2971)